MKITKEQFIDNYKEFIDMDLYSELSYRNTYEMLMVFLIHKFGKEKSKEILDEYSKMYRDIFWMEI